MSRPYEYYMDTDIHRQVVSQGVLRGSGRWLGLDGREAEVLSGALCIESRVLRWQSFVCHSLSLSLSLTHTHTHTHTLLANLRPFRVIKKRVYTFIKKVSWFFNYSFIDIQLDVTYRFGLVSLFNGISTLFRLFNAKSILLEEQ